MTKTYLEFHFQNDILSQERIAFSEPIRIFETDEVDEIPQLIEEIESYVNKGYYAAGYLSYEAAPAFNPKMDIHNTTDVPLLWFGIYSEPAPLRTSPHASATSLKWELDTSRTEYNEAIERIKREISLGNTYQVNYTVRLKSPFEQEPYPFFHQLLHNQQAKYSAYLDIGRYKIASASPELFFAWDGNRIVTKPMKGTIKRGLSAEEDLKRFKSLKESEKDQAENVMIVDLLRNDLAQIAQTGSVEVTRLFEIEAYPTVYQMTSTVEALTKNGLTLFQLFEALFPCGSITGAPKLSTMKLIKELETSPRNVYCGALGYIQPDHNAVFNVPIRTVWMDSQSKTATFGVGGGVTWDSTSSGEYEEIFSKGKFLNTQRPQFDLLESFRLEDGSIFLLAQHLNRLKGSADYFNFVCNLEQIHIELRKLAERSLQGLYKIRLVLKRDGTFSTETVPTEEIVTSKICNFAEEPVDQQNLFLYHKTTNRKVYSDKRIGNEAFFDTLLWNKDGNVTEFTNGNIVCLINGHLVTPPIQDGLLAGTFRQILLEKGELLEQTISIQDLKKADKVWFINSVRNWVEVRLN